MQVILFRPKDLAKESLKELRPLKVFLVPAIQTVALPSRIPREKKYDFILFTSANSIRHLKFFPKTENILCIGDKTFQALPAKYRSKAQVLQESQSTGVKKYFDRVPPSSVFFPRSAVADSALANSLRRRHELCVRNIYTTKSLPVRRLLNSRMKASKIDCFFLTSPSSVYSLLQSFSKKELKSFPVQWVAIGSVTAAAIRKRLKIRPICADNSLSSMKNLALKSKA